MFCVYTLYLFRLWQFLGVCVCVESVVSKNAYVYERYSYSQGRACPLSAKVTCGLSFLLIGSMHTAELGHSGMFTFLYAIDVSIYA